jgi:ribosomal-protein-alanine N-acetyltransferase
MSGNLAVNICSMSETDVVEVKKIEAEYNLSPWSVEDYYSEIKRTDSISLVVKVNNKIIGFVIGRLIISQNTTFYDIEIYNICVANKFRRNGIGKSLIDKLANTSKRNIKSIWLDVRRSNDRALAFYKKLNFKIIYTRKNFYRNPTEDGLVLKMEV